MSGNFSRRKLIKASPALIGLLAGCNNLGTRTETPPPPPIDDLELSIYDVRRPDIGVRSTTLTFILSATNPADRAIPNPSGDIDVYINDEFVGAAEPFFNTLEPGETARESIDVVIENSDIATSLASALREGTFEFHIEGVIRSEGVSKEFTLSYSFQ